MSWIIESIYVLFFEQNPGSYFWPERVKEYTTDRKTFDKKAKEWTKKYASY